MQYLITGGSGSGKSEYAEELSLSLNGERRIYLATMRIWDEEGRARVQRHTRMRSGKGFLTVERSADLASFLLSELPFAKKWGQADVILLECMSNLAVNEFYDREEGAGERILRGIHGLRAQCRDLVIVTNEVFSDGMAYDEETRRYASLLAGLNRELARDSDVVTEVVFGIPTAVKRQMQT